jgi:hypothetical protein
VYNQARSRGDLCLRSGDHGVGAYTMHRQVFRKASGLNLNEFTSK